MKLRPAQASLGLDGAAACGVGAGAAERAGATAEAAPETKPWGQTVAYVRDNRGFLVELCTPMP